MAGGLGTATLTAPALMTAFSRRLAIAGVGVMCRSRLWLRLPLRFRLAARLQVANVGLRCARNVGTEFALRLLRYPLGTFTVTTLRLAVLLLLGWALMLTVRPSLRARRPFRFLLFRELFPHAMARLTRTPVLTLARCRLPGWLRLSGGSTIGNVLGLDRCECDCRLGAVTAGCAAVIARGIGAGRTALPAASIASGPTCGGPSAAAATTLAAAFLVIGLTRRVTEPGTGLAGYLLDVLRRLEVIEGDERVRVSELARAAGAADAVDIVVGCRAARRS